MRKVITKVFFKITARRAQRLATKLGKKVVTTGLIDDDGRYLGSMLFYRKEDVLAMAKHLTELAEEL